MVSPAMKLSTAALASRVSPAAFRQRGALVPSRSFRNGLEHTKGTGVIETIRPFSGRWQLRRVQQVDSELHWIFASRVRELVDERFAEEAVL